MMLKKRFLVAAFASTVIAGTIAGLMVNGTTAQLSGRSGYRMINLQRFVSQNKLNGLNPNQIGAKLFTDQEEAEGRQSESLDIKYSRQNPTVIILIKEGLADDSVRALRQRVEMVRNRQGNWEIVWVGEQNKCQKGRGSQNWTAKLCS